eukprot:CAMPEP_0119331622 /NCGR_PEP_ID=MMETSP1333-20130426/80964_1 /TAXON_ID=418940 /ORGANISM="Scyphosphaera apsteinii, Strain RCC1455" /LENGTH=98 /DNA_ID=CAMNT_0007341275 /DNA_START=264 /DNA_END=557 /DNA_ORIENTATION=-
MKIGNRGLGGGGEGDGKEGSCGLLGDVRLWCRSNSETVDAGGDIGGIDGELCGEGNVIGNGGSDGMGGNMGDGEQDVGTCGGECPGISSGRFDGTGGH